MSIAPDADHRLFATALLQATLASDPEQCEAILEACPAYDRIMDDPDAFELALTTVGNVCAAGDFGKVLSEAQIADAYDLIAYLQEAFASDRFEPDTDDDLEELEGPYENTEPFREPPTNEELMRLCWFQRRREEENFAFGNHDFAVEEPTEYQQWRERLKRQGADIEEWSNGLRALSKFLCRRLDHLVEDGIETITLTTSPDRSDPNISEITVQLAIKSIAQYTFSTEESAAPLFADYIAAAKEIPYLFDRCEIVRKIEERDGSVSFVVADEPLGSPGDEKNRLELVDYQQRWSIRYPDPKPVGVNDPTQPLAFDRSDTILAAHLVPDSSYRSPRMAQDGLYESHLHLSFGRRPYHPLRDKFNLIENCSDNTSPDVIAHALLDVLNYADKEGADQSHGTYLRLIMSLKRYRLGYRVCLESAIEQDFPFHDRTNIIDYFNRWLRLIELDLEFSFLSYSLFAKYFGDLDDFRSLEHAQTFDIVLRLHEFLHRVSISRNHCHRTLELMRLIENRIIEKRELLTPTRKNFSIVVQSTGLTSIEVTDETEPCYSIEEITSKLHLLCVLRLNSHLAKAVNQASKTDADPIYFEESYRNSVIESSDRILKCIYEHEGASFIKSLICFVPSIEFLPDIQKNNVKRIWPIDLIESNVSQVVDSRIREFIQKNIRQFVGLGIDVQRILISGERRWPTSPSIVGVFLQANADAAENRLNRLAGPVE